MLLLPDLYSACVHGHTAMVEWLVEHFGLDVEDIRAYEDDALVVACRAAGNLPVVRFLVDRFNLYTDAGLMVQLVVAACKAHCTEIACWLVHLNAFQVERVRYHLEKLILLAAEQGNVTACQWIVETLDLGPEFVREHNMLVTAFTKCRLKLAKWLVARFELTAEDAKDVHLLAEVVHIDAPRMKKWLADKFGLVV